MTEKIAYRPAPRAEHRLSSREAAQGRSALGLERHEVVRRTEKGRWVGVVWRDGRRSLVSAARGKKAAVVPVKGALAERFDVHPTLERALVLTTDLWGTRIVEVDLDDGASRVLGLHKNAKKAGYAGDERILVVDPSGVTLYRRDPDRLTLLGSAPAGGFDGFAVRDGAALLVLGQRGLSLVRVSPLTLTVVRGSLPAPDGASVFERDGRVFEDVEGGKVREIVLPTALDPAPSLDRWLRKLAESRAATGFGLAPIPPSEVPGDARAPTVTTSRGRIRVGKVALACKEAPAPEELRFSAGSPLLVAAPVGQVFEIAGGRARVDATGHVGVEAIARIDADAYALVTSGELRIRRFGKEHLPRLGLECLDVAPLPGTNLLCAIDRLENGERHPDVRGASAMRLDVVDPSVPRDLHTWWLPGGGWRLALRGERVFVNSGELAFELTGRDPFAARHGSKRRPPHGPRRGRRSG